MKSAAWRSVLKSQLHGDEGWSLSGNLAYKSEFTFVLFGIKKDSSSHSNSSYVWKVTLPLFVPTDVLNLTYSSRSPIVDDRDSAALQAAILAASPTESDSEVAALTALANRVKHANFLIREAASYALLVMGRVDAAYQGLGTVAAVTPTYEWYRRPIARAQAMRTMIENGELDQALAQLEAWTSESVANLGLVRLKPA